MAPVSTHKPKDSKHHNHGRMRSLARHKRTPTMTSLMLHCGARLASREEVFAVPTPEATPSYVPLPYASLLTRIEKQLTLEGITITQERLALGKQGQRLFGLLQVQLPQASSEIYGCLIGVRNSYDKSCATGLCIGARVFVCDNLSFHGSHITFERKHTPNLLRDLSWIITETVNQLPALFAEQSKAFHAYRQTKLSEAQAHDVLIRCLDEGVLNVTDIPRALQEWRTPSHAQFLESGRSGWRLFNAVTETIKGDLWRLPARSKALHAVLDVECGVSTAKALPVEALGIAD